MGVCFAFCQNFLPKNHLGNFKQVLNIEKWKAKKIFPIYINFVATNLLCHYQSCFWFVEQDFKWLCNFIHCTSLCNSILLFIFFFAFEFHNWFAFCKTILTIKNRMRSDSNSLLVVRRVIIAILPYWKMQIHLCMKPLLIWQQATIMTWKQCHWLHGLGAQLCDFCCTENSCDLCCGLRFKTVERIEGWTLNLKFPSFFIDWQRNSNFEWFEKIKQQSQDSLNLLF